MRSLGLGAKIIIGFLVLVVLTLVLPLLWYRYRPDGQEVRDVEAFAKPDTMLPPAGMVWIEGGQFEMGTDEPSAAADEKPAHPVRVDGFWMMDHEITNHEFELYLQNKPSAKGKHDALRSIPKGWENLPAVNVSWNDALNYCAWAGMRLPTEAEWEFAVKGQQHDQTKKQLHWTGNFSSGKLNVVKSNSPNSFQLYDLAGNVWEWCGDYYNAGFHKKYAAELLQANVIEASHPADSNGSAAEFRVAKGGSFLSAPTDAAVKRPTARKAANADSGYADIGFRPVMTTTMWEVKKRLQGK